MSVIQKTADSAREAFQAMPMQSRVIGAMLAVAIAISLAFLVRSNQSSGTEYLLGGRSFSDQEMADIALALGAAGLGDFDPVGNRIKIPTESRAKYLAALQESPALAASIGSKIGEALNATGPFDSNDLRIAREMHAKEQDLGSKITKFPDVRWASVEYDRGERRGLGSMRPQSASVVVQPMGTTPLARQRIMAIKELIRGSYAGMSGDDVVVIDTNSTSTSTLAEDEDPLLRKQRETEAMVEHKIRSLLVGYPVQVAVTAEIDPTLDVEKTTLTYDAEPTNLQSRTRKTETTSNRQPDRGVPGTGPNAIGNRAASLAQMTEANTTKDDERVTTGVAGQQYQNSRTAPLQVTTIRASVGLPRSYYDKLYYQEQLKSDPTLTAETIPPMDDAALQKLRERTSNNIKAAVTVLLPEVAAGADPFTPVEVWDYPDLPIPAAPAAQTSAMVLTWLAESWQTVALVMLALAALLVARSAAKNVGSSSPKEFNEGFGLEIPTPPEEMDGAKESENYMTITGGSLKDELLDVVESNPELAANVIRGWVGEAA
ncbi:MAG: beta-cystathionase [Planctomycetaceae bacterium]|nr:beta-cystathionase [Planctomycetaceae bacterium]